jgi:hypothetical protein
MKYLIFISMLFNLSISFSSQTKIDVDKEILEYQDYLIKPYIIIPILSQANLIPSRLGKAKIIDENEVQFEYFNFNLKLDSENKIEKEYFYNANFDYKFGPKILSFKFPIIVNLNDSSINLTFLEFENLPFFLKEKINDEIKKNINEINQENILSYLKSLCSINNCNEHKFKKNLYINIFNNHSQTKEESSSWEPGDAESFSDIIFFVSGFFLWLTLLLFFVVRRIKIRLNNMSNS